MTIFVLELVYVYMHGISYPLSYENAMEVEGLAALRLEDEDRRRRKM